MEKILGLLAVVLIANISFAQMKKIVDQPVDKSGMMYGDFNYLKKIE